MLKSELFAGDPLLEMIVRNANGQKISMSQNRTGPTVRKIQQALLAWDPGCLPQCGADGVYDDETSRAITRFQRDMMQAEQANSHSVGYPTIRWLDAMALSHEQNETLAGRRSELDCWLTADLTGVFSPISSSDARVHITGNEAFASLHRELAACVDERAIILLACWDFHESTRIAPGVTIGAALRAAAERGAKVRALFNHIPVFHLPIRGEWRPMTVNNDDKVTFVNSLPGGVAIHDSRVLHRSAGSLGLPLPGVKFQVAPTIKKPGWCGRGSGLRPGVEASTSIPTRRAHRRSTISRWSSAASPPLTCMRS